MKIASKIGSNWETTKGHTHTVEYCARYIHYCLKLHRGVRKGAINCDINEQSCCCLGCGSSLLFSYLRSFRDFTLVE